MTKDTESATWKDFDHPCKNSCSGWKQGFEKGEASAAKVISEKDERIAEFIETINAVQNKIGIWARGSSSFGKDINDAWNLNARALGCKEQSTYLSLRERLASCDAMIEKLSNAVKDIHYIVKPDGVWLHFRNAILNITDRGPVVKTALLCQCVDIKESLAELEEWKKTK